MLGRVRPVTGMKSEINNGALAHKRIRILIADDSAAFRNAVCRLLEKLPEVEVVGTAEDGQEAVDLVVRTRPDLVLMDLKMPRLSGLLATRKLRAEFPGVRVIIITLHASAQSKAASEAAGAVQFIPKHRLRDDLPGALAQLFPGWPSRTEAKRP